MTKKLAFLGYGLRSKTMLQAFREIEADISVAAVADPRWEQIKEENAGDPLFAEARYFENADALLGGCEPDGVFIGTRCPLQPAKPKSAVGLKILSWSGSATGCR